MATLELNVEVREGTGKGVARQLRREGWIPGVLYGQESDPRPLRVRAHDLEGLFQGMHSEHAVVNLRFPGESAPQAALIREVQHHPTRGDFLHIDFNQVSATRKIRIDVPVDIEGEPIGVKDFGGVLEHGIREVEVECFPGDLPEMITVDVSALMIGDSVHVSALTVPDRVVIHTDPQSVIAVVVPPAVVKEAAPPTAEEEAAAEEGEAPKAEEESTPAESGKAD